MIREKIFVLHMRKVLILLFTIFCTASIFMNRAAGILFPEPEVVVNGGSLCSVLSVADDAKLGDIFRYASYDIQTPCSLQGGERSFQGTQRRTPQAERFARLYGMHLLDVSVLKSKLSGLNHKNYLLRQSSDGLYLNVSDPNEFFIFSLRKIRV